MWPMVEQVLSSQVRAGNLTEGVAFSPAGSVCPRLGLKEEERVVLRGTERMRKVSWKVAYMDFLQIVCGSPHKLKATTQRRGGKCNWG